MRRSHSGLCLILAVLPIFTNFQEIFAGCTVVVKVPEKFEQDEALRDLDSDWIRHIIRPLEDG